ncbi:uncharacterized protein LOC127796736 [Diospyros lotus]|uniref:uncharacterized protein LOC127796736 n=1 Tax=Diospyros lotus TaxID=55363 RepID=UPI002258EA2F|nr:uncharacterized protein LOC127796736 [Diospyros lotus]
MGTRKTVLLLIFSFHFYYSASLFPLDNNLPSVGLQEIGRGKKLEENSTSNNGARDGIARSSSVVDGAVSHRSVAGGSGDEGNGSGSKSPETGGGAAIPLYAAGAVRGHHTNHRGAGSCSRSCVGLPTLCAIIFASLSVHILVVLRTENLMKPA